MLSRAVFVCVLVGALGCWSKGNGKPGDKGAPALPAEGPLTVTPSGSIRGSWMTTRRGRLFQAYRGIRYAEPPVGELRFQPPKPILQYKGEVDASKEGPACPLPAPPTYYVDEDCLTINVYTPNNKSDKPLPVIFFIHAGGFYSMTGRSDLAGPHYLLDRDVVLVTINYRLGSLGFLSTGDALAPGNNGFKDQVVALRWVQKNIRSFGGDPNLVTITGCSAGSISVMLHMVSPMSKGLFHRGISMSASPVGKEPLREEMFDLAQKQAKILNCPQTNTSEAILSCLKTKTFKELGDSLPKFFDQFGDPIGVWMPIVERDFGQERFLAKQPADSIRTNDMYAVPHMISQTTDEFFWKAFSVVKNKTLLDRMNNEFDRVAPVSFQISPLTSTENKQKLRRAYLGDKPLVNDDASTKALGKLYGDAVIGYPVHVMANMMSRHSPQKVFYYEFAHIGNHSHYEDPNTKKPTGAAHHDDLIYLFTLSYRFPTIEVSDSEDSKLVDRMTAIWYNFAKYGDPNNPADAPLPELTSLRWPPMTSGTRQYLRIDNDFSVHKKMFEDRFKVWEEIYPQEQGSVYPVGDRDIGANLPIDINEAPALPAEGPLTVTPSGSIRGSWMTTRRGRQFQAYRGIRYAEPPVGELRFQPPKPILHYEAEVDASKEGPSCPKPSRPNYYVDEDCLVINVYTPSNNSSKPLPVIFYIHAGGFYTMSGRSDLAGPHYLLDRDVVLVTVNYRLGSLGFLSTGDALAPGNNGFKDQVVALRWVQKNIRAFGGDPNLVTISGCSAGSRSVTLHMVSPMSKGLFHRGISMSASSVGKEPLRQDMFDLAVKQARILDCPQTNTSEAIISCLKTKTFKELGDSLPKFFDQFGYDPVTIWLPVVERDFGQERFLTEDPADSIRNNNFYSVPYMISRTTDEFFWKAFTVLKNKTLLDTMNSEWDRIAPISFQMSPNTSTEYKQKLKLAYLGDKPLVDNEASAKALGKLYGDAITGFPVHALANMMSRHSPLKVFYSEFAYIGNHSHYEDTVTKKPIGVAHHDDLIYLFTLSYRFPTIEFSDSLDSKLVDKMTGIWYNFAKYGDPNNSPGEPLPELSTLKWPVMTSDNRQYLRVDQDFSIHENLFEDRYKVWEEIYPMK